MTIKEFKEFLKWPFGAEFARIQRGGFIAAFSICEVTKNFDTGELELVIQEIDFGEKNEVLYASLYRNLAESYLFTEEEIDFNPSLLRRIKKEENLNVVARSIIGAKLLGYDVDTCCYPHLAYNGGRFLKQMSFKVETLKESKLRNYLKIINPVMEGLIK